MSQAVCFISFVAVLALLAGPTDAAAPSQTATVARYDFETIGGNSNAVPGNLKLCDASDAGLHISSEAGNSRSVGLTSDVAAMMPGNTLALDSNNAGADLFSTPSSAVLHRGTTGALTIEFWWKSITLPDSF